jgi:HAE1 family hydrophobic/amphiphilic exporter-1
MTAMTTILGLSPMVAPFFLPQVFGAVDGRAAFWAPVGLVILGGLTTATFLTVMVTPVVYSLIDDLTNIFRRVAAQATQQDLPAATAPAIAPAKYSQMEQ